MAIRVDRLPAVHSASTASVSKGGQASLRSRRAVTGGADETVV